MLRGELALPFAKAQGLLPTGVNPMFGVPRKGCFVVAEQPDENFHTDIEFWLLAFDGFS